jgi:hypothetical protein
MASRFHINKQYFDKADWTVEQSSKEIKGGLKILNGVKRPIVTFFGSHKVPRTSPYYKHAEKVAFALGKAGYAILSGGGPGVMHAANSGATRAKTTSIGTSALLLTKEMVTDPIFTHKLPFHFLFARRFIMSIKSDALIFYPGGYGTLNELFEYLVLMQTGIVDTVPIICVNKRYWSGLLDWLKKNPLKNEFLIHDARDIGLIHFADDAKEILRIIRKG